MLVIVEADDTSAKDIETLQNFSYNLKSQLSPELLIHVEFVNASVYLIQIEHSLNVLKHILSEASARKLQLKTLFLNSDQSWITYTPKK